MGSNAGNNRSLISGHQKYAKRAQRLAKRLRDGRGDAAELFERLDGEKKSTDVSAVFNDIFHSDFSFQLFGTSTYGRSCLGRAWHCYL